MPLQSIFTMRGNTGNDSLNTGEFGVLILGIIIGWILVSVFLRVVENFFFETLSMNSRSTFHAIIIAITMYLLFILFVNVIDELQIIPASRVETSLSEATGGLESVTSQGAKASVTSQLSNMRRGHPIVITPTVYY